LDVHVSQEIAVPFTASSKVAESIRAELEMTRSSFHALLESLSEEDLKGPSFNRGWTNGEILAHMVFGFIILNTLLPVARIWGRLPRSSSKPFAWLLNISTGAFNWFNALGARMQRKVFTYKRLGALYDRIYSSLLKAVGSIQDEEWKRGMYYPTRWDPNFSKFMTIEELFHYPIVHFNHHLGQIQHQGRTQHADLE
jgi:DinB family protein